MTCTTCPNCGFDLTRVDDLVIGALHVVAGAEVHWQGQRVPLTVSQVLIVCAIARAGGGFVTIDAMLQAIGYDGDADKLIDVHICRINKAFRGIDSGFNRIERERGRASNRLTRWRCD